MIATPSTTRPIMRSSTNKAADVPAIVGIDLNTDEEVTRPCDVNAPFAPIAKVVASVPLAPT